MTTRFTGHPPVRRVVAVDWSGAVRGAARGIWLADVSVVGLELRDLRGGWTREAVSTHLIALADEEQQLVVGLDFAFSLPRWFLDERGYASAPALWTDIESCEAWATNCPAPFWGRGQQSTRPTDLDEARRLRRTEREVGERFGVRPMSVFQLGGAGTVGTGSLRGMRVLAQLRAAGFSIWPFDTPRFPLVVEVYPRVHVPGVRVSDATARRDHLTRHGWPVNTAQRDTAAGDSNAFDAAVTAFAMARNANQLVALEPARDDDDRLEGRIWAPQPTAEPLRTGEFFAPLSSAG